MAIVIGYPNQSALRAPIIIIAFFWTLFRKGTKINLHLLSLTQLFWSSGILILVLLSRLWALDPRGIDDVGVNVLWCMMISFVMFDYVVTYHITVRDLANHLIPIMIVLVINLLVNGTSDKNRLTASINANTFGEICVGMLHYFLYLWWTQKKGRGRNLAVMLLLVGMTLLTGSRKSVIALVVFFVGYFQFERRSLDSRKKLLRLIAILAVVAVIYLLMMSVDTLYQSIGHRIESLLLYVLAGFDARASGVDTSIFSRTNMVGIAASFFYKHPILGIGANNFKYNVYYGTYSHNGYMEILSGLGLVGFAVYYLPVAAFLRRAVKSWRRDVPDAIVPICVLLCFLIIEVGRVTYFSYHSYCLLSIAMGMVHNMNRNLQGPRRGSLSGLKGKTDESIEKESPQGAQPGRAGLDAGRALSENQVLRLLWEEIEASESGDLQREAPMAEAPRPEDGLHGHGG